MTVKKTLDDWLAFYEQLHPVGIDLGLERAEKVWSSLCQTQHIEKIAKQVITVAGTNGKGSTCQMLSCLLQQPTTKVGVYSSPHIHRFNERIKINDKEVDDEIIIRAFVAIEAARQEITLSYFEATTLAGLLVFAWEGVDVAVLEVGLGGRLDAINIIDADAAIITSIAKDHENFLGNDLSQIALEKAGVFRINAPAVYAQANIYDSVIDFAKKIRTPLLVNQRDYQIIFAAEDERSQLVFQKKTYDLPKNLIALGKHQLQNAAAAMILLIQLQILPNDYELRLSNFQLKGRLQKIARFPDVIVDVAHNEEAAQALAGVIQQQRQNNRYKKYYAVMGMLKDKDHAQVFSALANLFDDFYFASTSGERGFSAEQLNVIYQQQNTIGGEVSTATYSTLQCALKDAKKNAHHDDVIYAFGSFLVVEALT